jgi:hypothetical protein
VGFWTYSPSSKVKREGVICCLPFVLVFGNTVIWVLLSRNMVFLPEGGNRVLVMFVSAFPYILLLLLIIR